MKYNSIDIFCKCIDNFGDAGVTYRFARELKSARPECRVRVFIDDMQTLAAVIGGSGIGANVNGNTGIDSRAGICTKLDVQTFGGITYISTASVNDMTANAYGVADVMVEMFACHIPEPLLEIAYDNSKLIINLEYLSAEDWVEDYHLKESLLGRGTVRKFYFMPGLREGTGGLILNSEFGMRNAELKSNDEFDERRTLNDILTRYGVDIDMSGMGDDHLIGTVFTYERGFDKLIDDLNATGRSVTLLVFGEKSKRGMMETIKRKCGIRTVFIAAKRSEANAEFGIKVKTSKNKNDLDFDFVFNSAFRIPHSALKIIPMPFLPQHDYDTLLCCTDFNIVRGEDSLARAILSGKPFIWQAYIQDEKYQLVKVEALLKTMRPYFDGLDGDNTYLYDAYRDLMLAFNDVTAESPVHSTCERYDIFFENLQKYSQVARAINYFMLRHCDLIGKFFDFIDNYQ